MIHFIWHGHNDCVTPICHCLYPPCQPDSQSVAVDTMRVRQTHILVWSAVDKEKIIFRHRLHLDLMTSFSSKLGKKKKTSQVWFSRKAGGWRSASGCCTDEVNEGDPWLRLVCWFILAGVNYTLNHYKKERKKEKNEGKYMKEQEKNVRLTS